jgi:hypothetical protein
MSRLRTEALNQVTEVGYALVPSCLDAATLSELGDLLDAGHAGVRNLLEVPAIRRLASSSAVVGCADQARHAVSGSDSRCNRQRGGIAGLAGPRGCGRGREICRSDCG